jgi:hypothetical protein
MNNTFTSGPRPNTVRAADGRVLAAPESWALLPPGDAALTQRVKEAGDRWVVEEKKGRKTFSRGVWPVSGGGGSRDTAARRLSLGRGTAMALLTAIP